MNNEIKLIQTTDYILKERIIKKLVTERISFLQKEKAFISRVKLFHKLKPVYCIYVDKNQLDQAREIINTNASEI